MNIRCENCGQLALATDKVCWHCGKPLPGRDIEEPEKVAVNEGWQHTQSIGTIGGYVVVAVVVILSALVVTHILGQQPKVSAEVGQQAPDGWEVIRDLNSRFTFYLPEEWRWFEPVRREERSDPALSELLEAGDFFLTGMTPFSSETDDLEVDFLAVSTPETAELESESAVMETLITADAFMLVSRSRRLNGLTYDDATQLLFGSGLSNSRAEVQVETDRSYLEIYSEIPVAGENGVDHLSCNQQFFLGEEESMLATVCAKDYIYSTYVQTFRTILSSFQRLS
ncbi:MAG: zinc ribbon domain-containing protein [Candidatus Promineifilaceae bacterium]